MGKTNININTKLKKLSNVDLQNKELVIKMLRWEEEYAKHPMNQERYKNKLTEPFVSLTNEKAFNRATLLNFGFDTCDDNVNMYRLIFKTYYNSPLDYDKDVINASYYMRNNRLKFYKTLKLHKNDIIPNCNLYLTNGINKTMLYDELNNYDYYMIHAFSTS